MNTVAGETTSPQGSSDADRSSLLRAIEATLAQIIDSRRSMGWTRWALLVALAVSLKALIDAGDAAAWSVQPSVVALWFVASHYFLDMVGLARGLMSSSTPTSSGPRFRYLSDLSDSRFEVLVGAVKYLAIAWLTVGVALIPNQPTKWAIFANYSLLAAGALVVFALSFKKVPLSAAMTHGKSRWIPFIQLAVGIAALSYLVRLVIIAPQCHASESVRFAGLLVSSTLLVEWFVSELPGGGSIALLRDIHRRVAFEEMPLVQARREASVAVLGLEVSDVLQERTAEILVSFENLASTRSAMAMNLELAKPLFEKGPSATQNDHATLLALATANKANAEKMSAISKKLKKQLDGYGQLSGWLKGISPASSEPIDRIGAEINQVARNLERVEETFLNAAAALSQVLSPAGKDAPTPLGTNP